MLNSIIKRAVTLVLGMTLGVHAALLVRYTFDVDGSFSANPTTVAEHYLATSIGTTFNNSGSWPVAAPKDDQRLRWARSNSSGWIVREAGESIDDVEERTVSTPNLYFHFTITPEPEAPYLSLDRLTFETAWANVDPEAVIFVRSNADGDDFSTTLGAFDIDSGNSGGTIQAGNLTEHTINLAASDVDFSDITGGVAFRFYMYSREGAATAQGNVAGFSNVQLLAIAPPPGTLLMMR